MITIINNTISSPHFWAPGATCVNNVYQIFPPLERCVCMPPTKEQYEMNSFLAFNGRSARNVWNQGGLFVLDRRSL